MKRENKKIRVAIVAPSTKVLGGQSIQAKRLIDGFAVDENIELSLIPNNPTLKFFGFLQKIKGIRTIATSVKFWWLLLTQIIEFDIVQVFSSGTTSYIISTLPPLFVAKFYGKKVFLNYHTGEAEEHLKKGGWWVKYTMEEFDKIVVPSEFLVDVFAKYKLKAETVFNFVDAENFKFRKRKPLKPIFLSNRTFENHYNVSCTLKAFAEIQKEFADAKLIVAGFGSEEEELKNLAQTLGLKNVDFIGKISPEEMPAIYEKADIYLNSSVVDNMPLSIIEAFSCGLPVVSSNAGGIPYIVENGETGLLSKNNDCLELAENSLKLLQDEELSQKIIDKSRLECVKYSWDKVQLEWQELYLRLAER
ncbi:MAG: glycosyltransferase family 4 protein [Acidobacteriota bacterium]|jgi:glycosyltransferase involved in cell wall biosynthesis|nr:glycosyltransferase family 4 protein [Acidobacteriota bacterium]